MPERADTVAECGAIMNDVEPREQRLIIILADISGYTKFMVENQLTAVHGQMVITHLIESLLREIDLPLELQEIEGDAVFLYAARPDDDAQWQEVLKQVQVKLVRFFEVFIEATVGLGEMTACQCAICTHLHELKLKVIAHSGRAVFHSIGQRKQVSGADVILAHRLLKNSVPHDEYLLLSDAAYLEFGHGLGLEFHDGQESYEGLGTVKTHVHFLRTAIDQARERFYARDPAEEKAAIRAYMSGAPRPFLSAALKQVVRPASGAGLLRRLSFVVGWLFYLPIFSFLYPRRVAEKLARNRARRGTTPSTRSP